MRGGVDLPLLCGGRAALALALDPTRSFATFGEKACSSAVADGVLVALGHDPFWIKTPSLWEQRRLKRWRSLRERVNEVVSEGVRVEGAREDAKRFRWFCCETGFAEKYIYRSGGLVFFSIRGAGGGQGEGRGTSVPLMRGGGGGMT